MVDRKIARSFYRKVPAAAAIAPAALWRRAAGRWQWRGVEVIPAPNPPGAKLFIHGELIIDASGGRAYRAFQGGRVRSASQARHGRVGAMRDGTSGPGTSGQGSNSGNVRHFNERVILNALRRLGAASKADLARFANLTNNTAGVIVGELEAQNLIRVEGKRAGQRGQPATLLSLNPEGAYAIGVKIGRRSIDSILVDFCGSVLARRRIERVFPAPPEAVAIVVAEFDRLRRLLPAGELKRLAGLGVATPYNLGSWRRELDLPAEPASGWNDFDLVRQLSAATGVAVFGENDGTAATVAELHQGHGRSLTDFLYVFIGSAIGGGVVVNGNYHRGVTGNAGDLGLMPVAPSRLASAPASNRPCDILLTRASINALIRHLRHAGIRVADRAALEAAIAAQPSLVEEWLADCVDALVWPVLSAARVLDVQAVVLDGDLPKPLLESLIGRLGEALAQAAPEAREAPDLRLGTVGREAAAIGAAILPLHLSFSPNREILLGLQG
ncbi:MAG: ROK family protein [Azospirillum sp.]|nr:ROK family protein [Azospirillum sp.]